MYRQHSDRTKQKTFIVVSVMQLGKSNAAEEKIVEMLVHKFGKPHDGNTDWWRYEIRHAQGRRKNEYIRD